MPDLDTHLPAIASGDVRAFARWLARAEPRLRASLSSFATRVDTEAVMQECLLRVWQLAPRIETDGRGDSLLRFAIRVAYNLAVGEVRRDRSGHRSQAAFEAEVDRQARRPGSDPTDPLLRRLIARCRERLPAQPARALTQRLEAAGGASDAELARRVGMRRNTFLKNFGRARRLLADCLREHGVDPEFSP